MLTEDRLELKDEDEDDESQSTHSLLRQAVRSEWSVSVIKRKDDLRLVSW